MFLFSDFVRLREQNPLFGAEALVDEDGRVRRHRELDVPRGEAPDGASASEEVLFVDVMVETDVNGSGLVGRFGQSPVAENHAVLVDDQIRAESHREALDDADQVFVRLHRHTPDFNIVEPVELFLFRLFPLDGVHFPSEHLVLLFQVRDYLEALGQFLSLVLEMLEGLGDFGLEPLDRAGDSGLEVFEVPFQIGDHFEHFVDVWGGFGDIRPLVGDVALGAAPFSSAGALVDLRRDACAVELLLANRTSQVARRLRDALIADPAGVRHSKSCVF